MIFFFTLFIILTTAMPGESYAGEWMLQLTVGDTQHEEALLNLSSTSEQAVSFRATFPVESETYRFQLDWTSETAGEVRLLTSQNSEDSSDESDDEEKEESTEESEANLLFSFDLANYTNGYLISQGKFSGCKVLEDGYYQLVITSPTTFFFSVYDPTKESAITVTGRKTSRTVEKSFWSQMPSPMVMLGILLITQWMKPQVPNPRAQQQQANPQAAQENQVEEVNDDEKAD